MNFPAIILGIAALILLFLFVLQRREIKNISRRISELKSEETNALIHSGGGGKSFDELINEINQLLKQMQRSRISYQQKSHSLEQMMTNISHDLRTPLTSAMGYIRLIQGSDMSEEEKSRELAIVEKRLLRLEELINSFFEFSKIISNEKPPEISPVNLTAVLESSIAHYYDDYSAAGRQIAFECESRRIQLNSNQNMLMRIFDNLIGNALKHGSGELSVRAEVNETAHEVRIIFSNELTDADTEIDIGHIFDEFYTTDISRTKGNTGLGLAIVKQFTEMLGGSVSACDNGGDFVLTVCFPII